MESLRAVNKDIGASELNSRTNARPFTARRYNNSHSADVSPVLKSIAVVNVKFTISQMPEKGRVVFATNSPSVGLHLWDSVHLL